MLSLRSSVAFAVLISPALLSSCVLNMTRYTDGPVTEYLDQELPELDAPIAQTVSVETVTYNTADSQKGRMIGDFVAREIFFLPSAVGKEVGLLLEMDKSFSEKATLAALNKIAESRSQARLAGSWSTLEDFSIGTPSDSTQSTIKVHQERAEEAYANGDYLLGDISSSAASNARQIDQAFNSAAASSNSGFRTLGIAGAFGQAMIKNEFEATRGWIEHHSGAVGPEAPAGTHLSVFLLDYFDARAFQFDSRMRAAVYLVLTDAKGNSSAVLEGSDILNCEGDCDLFQPKPTAKVFNQLAPANEVQRMLSTTEGIDSIKAKGFGALTGPYQYVLLKHGLAKLAGAVKPPE